MFEASLNVYIALVPQKQFLKILFNRVSSKMCNESPVQYLLTGQLVKCSWTD